MVIIGKLYEASSQNWRKLFKGPYANKLARKIKMFKREIKLWIKSYYNSSYQNIKLT